MKNYLFLFMLGLALFSNQAFSQEDTESDAKADSKNYDKFSIEANVGMNRTDGYYSPGFYQTDAEKEYALGDVSHFDLGLRYMFNEKFGLKLDGAYDIFESRSDASAPYETNLLRFGLQGVANFRSILNFDSFTKKFGLLGHAGVHYGFFNGDSRNGIDIDGDADQVSGFMIGLTPQFKLSNTFVLTADATFIKNYRQHQTWDFNPAPNNSNLNAEFFNVSLGLTVYLGKNDTHADWYNPADETENELEKLRKRLADVEETLPTKADKTEEVPDYIQTYVNNYVDERLKDVDPGPVTKSLIEDGYVRIFFDFDKDMPLSSSVNDISALIEFLNNNPEQNIELIGMTDTLGSDAYNEKLSLRRAKNVHDILVEAGIDASRLEHRGSGKNPVYTSKNEYIRMLARTVTVKLK